MRSGVARIRVTFDSAEPVPNSSRTTAKFRIAGEHEVVVP